VKRVDLVRATEAFGCALVRHDWYRNPATGVSQPVLRYREIKDHLARHIVAMLSNSQAEDGGDDA